MSFQGDVAGIGLGELLQGLARGGRDGVLTLRGQKLSAAVGLHNGQLFLLAGPDETEDHWRKRCERAFAEDPEPGLEQVRRRQIARATRLQNLYRFLEAPNLHFRFEQGPLPAPSHHATAPSKSSIAFEGSEYAEDHTSQAWGPGLTVEYVLLEHARISDENLNGPASNLAAYDLPRALDAESHAPEARDFLAACDGNTTVQEIADRLGWPLAQCRAIIGEYLAAGHIRMAETREYLAAAQHELVSDRKGRAASRLTGWVHRTPPGIPNDGDVALLLSEWREGRLAPVLDALEPRIARTLLHKIDHVDKSPLAARDRWSAMVRAHRGDEISLVHEVVLRLTSTESADPQTFKDLLRVSRLLQDRNYISRTRTLLRLAASQMPTRPQTRVELGRRMLETGLETEGVQWLLETGNELIASGEYESAMVPIRAVLREFPENREALHLAERARDTAKRRKRRRWSMLAGLSVLLILSLGAFVKFHSYREMERWLVEINSQVGHPEIALKMLDEEFGSQPPPRIGELRDRLVALQHERETELYEGWMKTYHEAEDACRIRDPLLGLRLSLDLPAPPDVESQRGSWPDRQALLGVLASRLVELSRELDFPVDSSMEDLRQEQRLIDMLSDMLDMLPVDSPPEGSASFRFSIAELRETIVTRRAQRATLRAAAFAEAKEKDQDILLATARAHQQAGDLERSVLAYDRLVETDETLTQLPQLKKEIQLVREQAIAVRRANDLAEKGEHAEAQRLLKETCPRPIQFPLPYRVASRPSEARVELPDGRIRVTPFIYRSAVGERVTFKFASPGCQSRTVELTDPEDQMIYLHRFPERIWESTHSIEAAPVPAGDDHILADRYGRLRRLDSESRTTWEHRLRTLGGIARTPVFLPDRPGYLIVASEDGLVWIVQAQTGELEGPRDIGSPPVAGPTLTRGGVSMKFADGRIAVWTDSLEPVFYESEQTIGRRQEELNESGGKHLAILRASMDGNSALDSPSNGWRVEVHDREYRVVSPDGRGFTAERHGPWLYVAWEAPKAFVPLGRLWVSDQKGLRAYLPDQGELVDFTE